MQKHFILILYILLGVLPIASFAQNPAVVKAGVIVNDYLRDNQIQFLQGYFVGADIRLGAYDNSYIRVGGALGRMHALNKSDFIEGESFFRVNDGLEFARLFAGIEGRLRPHYAKFNMRWNLSLAVQTTINSIGTTVDNFNSSAFTIPIGIGVDIGFICFDLTFEPGLTPWIPDQRKTKPRMGTFSVGLQF